jgi:hypothetical protein
MRQCAVVRAGLIRVAPDQRQQALGFELVEDGAELRI